MTARLPAGILIAIVANGEVVVSKQAKHKVPPGTRAARDDVVRMFRSIDDDVVLQVLGLEPSIGELEEAYSWLEGEGDRLSRAGHTQTERIAALVDILRDDEEEPPYLR